MILQKLVFIFAILLTFTSCKKEDFLKCIIEYDKHEYRASLSCDNTSFEFDEVFLNRTILSDEMDIRFNGFLDDGFTTRVSSDCSFVTFPDAMILLPNEDTLFIQSGSGTKVDDNTVMLAIETDYDNNCILTIEKK